MPPPVSRTLSASSLPVLLPMEPPSASGAGPSSQAAPDGLVRRAQSARDFVAPDGAAQLRVDLPAPAAPFRPARQASVPRLAPPAGRSHPVPEVVIDIERLRAGQVAPPQPMAVRVTHPVAPRVAPEAEPVARPPTPAGSERASSSAGPSPENSPVRDEEGSSSLLTRAERAHPSDRFASVRFGSSSRFSAADFVSSTGVSSRFARSTAGSLRGADTGIQLASTSAPAAETTPPAAPPAATPAERIAAALGAMEFRATAPAERVAQQAMETEYVAWAAGVAQARERAFGPAGYTIGQDRHIAMGDAALPALYDGARQLLSSSSRSPVVNFFATFLGPKAKGTDNKGNPIQVGELNYRYDATVIGGTAGGLTAHFVDSTLLTAMDRRSRLANFPEFKAVDLKALVPDPSPVQLRVVEGRKEYWRPAAAGVASDPGAPSAAVLAEQVAAHRQALSNVQNMLQAKDWGLLVQPLLSGVTNVLRRLGLPDRFLLQAGHVMWGSMMSSGTGGGLAKLGLGLTKPAAYGDVDDLVGGRQRVNLFAAKAPNPDIAPASLADYKGLPGFGLDVVKESGHLAMQFVAGPWRASGSAVPSRHAVLQRVGDLARIVSANVLGSVFAAATGPFAAQIMRGGASAPLAGESQRSGAYLLQQFIQSATNDFAWQAAKEAFKGNTFDLGASLDRWRDGRQAQALQAARAAQDALPRLATALQEHPASESMRGVLQELQALERGQPVQVGVLQRAAEALRPQAHEPEVGALVHHIDAALAGMARHDEMARWRAPAGTAAPQADRAR